jgi:hypothetical protein
MVLAPPTPGRAFGLNIFKDVWDLSQSPGPKLVQLFSNPMLFDVAAEAAWANARPKLCDKIVAEIGKPNRLSKGITLYDITCRTGAQIARPASSFANGFFIFQFTIPDNYLEFTSTQPAVGKWGDPRLSISYDLEVTATIEVPSNTAPLTVRTAVVKVHNSKVDSHGFVGDVVLDFMQILTGGDFIGLVEGQINQAHRDITDLLNAQLAPANQILAQNAGPQGARLEAGNNPGQHTLALHIKPQTKRLFVSIATIQDHANLKPEDRGQVSHHVRVRVLGADLESTDRAQTAFAREVPAIDHVPIHIEVVRNITPRRVVLCGPPTAQTCPPDMPPGGNIGMVTPHGVSPGTLFALDLAYDFSTHRFTGTASGINARGTLYDRPGTGALCFTVSEDTASAASCGMSTMEVSPTMRGVLH